MALSLNLEFIVFVVLDEDYVVLVVSLAEEKVAIVDCEDYWLMELVASTGQETQ